MASKGVTRIFHWMAKTEELKADSGNWVLAEGAATPFPPARGSGERCELPRGVRVGAPTAQRFSIFSALQDGLSRHYNSLLLIWTIMQPLGGSKTPIAPSPLRTPLMASQLSNRRIYAALLRYTRDHLKQLAHNVLTRLWSSPSGMILETGVLQKQNKRAS